MRVGAGPGFDNSPGKIGDLEQRRGRIVTKQLRIKKDDLSTTASIDSREERVPVPSSSHV